MVNFNRKADELELLDEDAKRAIEDFNRIYNKSGSTSGAKFIEIQDEFEFLKDLSLKESDQPAESGGVNIETEAANEPKPGATVNDWLDDLLN